MEHQLANTDFDPARGHAAVRDNGILARLSFHIVQQSIHENAGRLLVQLIATYAARSRTASPKCIFGGGIARLGPFSIASGGGSDFSLLEHGADEQGADLDRLHAKS